MTPELLGLLALIGALCALAFYAGRLSSRAYLESARAVNEIAGIAAANANSYSAQLATSQAESASLRQSLTAAITVVGADVRGLQDSHFALLQGFENAGWVRRGTVGEKPIDRQRGEAPADPS